MTIPALTIANLQKTYDTGVKALQGIDLQVADGDFFALLGPNGAGKSTTISIIASLVRKTGGQVSVFEHNIDQDFESAKRCLGLVPQEFNFPQFETLMQIVVNQAGFYGIARKQATVRAEEVLSQLGLWDKRNARGRELSGGMKRRLMIARALMHKPRLLILDEPTAGVDIEVRRSMWDFLRALNEQGTTIVLTTHYLEEAEQLCRNIAIIDHGRIVENTSMKTLLAGLHQETFVLDVSAPASSPDSALLSIGGFQCRQVSGHSLEVDIDKTQTLNELFAALDAAGIRVQSMRNKSNRLEELFVRLVEKNKQERQQ